MTEKSLIAAINETAKELGLIHWIEVNDITQIPSAMNNLCHLMWIRCFRENENTKLIRDQQLNLINKGRLIFD